MRARSSIVVVAALLVPAVATAADPTKDECVDANTRAQVLRREGKLTGARDALKICMAASCPGIIREDCIARMDDLDRSAPPVVPEVQVAAVIPAAPAASAAQPSPAAVPLPAAAEPETKSRPLRTFGVIAGAVGVVGLAVGTGLAFDAKSKFVTARGGPSDARQSDSRDAVSQGNTATFIFAASGVLAATGIVLWFVAPEAKSDTSVGTNAREIFLKRSF